MKLSYLILTHNEPQALDLIAYVHRNKEAEDEIIILDDNSADGFFDTIKELSGVTIVKHKLTYSYSDHRNFGLSWCKGEFVFALDADEWPQQFLLNNVKKIIADTIADVIWLPRLNIFYGVTAEDAALWGWHLEDGLVNWNTGDYQCRLFRNGVGLEWHGNLHERLKVGEHHTQIQLTKDACFAIVHRKTIEQQRASNARYNAKYTEAENRGVK